jgi:hypothetical protein
MIYILEYDDRNLHWYVIVILLYVAIYCNIFVINKIMNYFKINRYIKYRNVKFYMGKSFTW